MAYEPIVLESNITGLGALPPPPNYYTNPEVEDRTAVVTNEDGTITAPTYQLEVNKPTFDLQNMQDLYGTKYMPMFRWISQKQTGSVTFDPEEGLISDEEAESLGADFSAETGMSAEEALREQYKQEGIAAVSQVAAGLGGQVGRSIASTVGAGETFGLGNISEGFTEFKDNFDFGKIGGDLFNAPDSGPASKLSFSPGTKKGSLASLKGTKAQSELKDFYKDKPEAFNERIADLKLVANDPKQLNVDRASADKTINSLEKMKTSGGTTTYGAGFQDRLDSGLFDGTGSAAGRANLYGAAGAGMATIAANLIAGKNLKESVKTGAKVGVGTYVGTLIGGGFGGMIGGIIGGRVICNELMRQGLLTRSEVLLDYRFTRDYLTPTHVNGYHVWAVWMVKQMRKGRFVGFWKHVAGHRANEIAYIYGDRDKPDYLGKAYRKILEPICWSIGFFCKATDWTVLYKKKEI